MGFEGLREPRSSTTPAIKEREPWAWECALPFPTAMEAEVVVDSARALVLQAPVGAEVTQPWALRACTQMDSTSKALLDVLLEAIPGQPSSLEVPEVVEAPMKTATAAAAGTVEA